MRQLTNDELLKIIGGVSITGALITSIYKGINTILDLGRSFGSAIRRIQTGSMCSL